MQLEILEQLEQKENPWQHIVFAYKKAWEATDFYNRLSQAEQIKTITYAVFFAEKIGEISSVVMQQEEGFIEISQEVIGQIEAVKSELEAAKKNLAPKVAKFGDVAGPEASRMYAALQARQNLTDNAKIVLDFARIMCDVTGATDIESEGYMQYSRLYNMLAKFLDCPLRGYDKADLLSMSVDELEYIDAQIAVREKTEKLSMFYLTYLEMIRKQISERVSMMKKLNEDESFPNF